MEIEDPGHRYRLATLDGVCDCLLTFVKREGPGYPGNVGHYPGTTLQEVLRVLIDRVQYLQQQAPCQENTAVLLHCRHSLRLLEERAARRHGRTCPVSLDIATIEQEPTCPTCGHLRCPGHCDEGDHHA